MDRWTCTAFCALISEIEGIKFVKNFYTRFDKSAILSTSINKQAGLYKLYNEYMHEWSIQLNVSSDKLEQFIFGWDKSRENQINNPRYIFEEKCMEIFTN